MKSERQKMPARELYDPMDPELVRARARDLCQSLNATREAEQEGANLNSKITSHADAAIAAVRQ